MLKIIHGADFHLDSPFTGLTPERAAQRREEQRELLDRLAEWYGFTVFYENPGVKGEKFFVSVDKYADGEKILQVLEEVSDVRFRVDGNVVRVYKMDVR